ncbi:MAG: hypothetical protein ABW224_21010 [Kibdelosporangium sp.]
MDIDFFARIVRTGTVLGLDAELEPEVVRRVAGDPVTQDADEEFLSWHYGVVRFAWIQRPESLPAQGFQFTVPVAEIAPGLLFDDLRTATGMTFGEFRRPLGGVQSHWQRESEMLVDADVETGTVVSLTSGFKRLFHVIHRYDHLSDELWEILTPDMRATWFAENEPAGAERADWWLYMCNTISARADFVFDIPQRALWLDYDRWVWETAVAEGLVHPAVAAMHLAEDYADAESQDRSLVPPVRDSLVAECLSHVTGSMSRTDKNLVDMARLHRHAVSDPALLASLDSWLLRRTDIPSVRAGQDTSVSLPGW